MLNPQEINSREFSKEIRGYSVGEVDDFLKTVAMDYDKLYCENIDLKDKAAVLGEAVKQYKISEERLKNALSLAQSAGDEIKRNATDKAKLILNDAESKASDILNDATREAAQLCYKYEQMRRNIEIYKLKVIELLSSQLEVINEFGEIDSFVSGKELLSEIHAVMRVSGEQPHLPIDSDELDRVTQELPRIVVNGNGEFVPAEIEDKDEEN